jgi:hybrid cluster-associated redox disulfide protein
VEVIVDKIALTADLTVDTVLHYWPETVSVFQAYKTACVGCAMASFDTIEDVAQIYKLDLDEFMQALQECINGSASGTISAS